jgi:hypothetical protein
MAQRNRPAEADPPADDALDLVQQAGEEILAQAELDAAIDVEDDAAVTQ